ncbi:MAG: hypothetical protein H7Y42_07825 [Chitinophagaceae bacterium]|nr:hypothetical protein [Chitinophagaceae bacterium]
MQTLKPIQKLSLVMAVAICIIAPTMGYLTIGLAPVIIVGGAAVIGFTFWYFTYLRNPTDPKIILPIFILTVAALQIHMVEEYLTGFGPAMSRIFNIPWSEKSFLMVFMMVGPIIYTLTTLGLYYKVPIAGFVAWFIFIGPGVAEFTHFIFPIIEPQLEPGNINAITQTIDGVKVASMPNYYYKTSGEFYFSGMWTAVLPMIPGVYAIYRLVKEHKRSKRVKAVV